MFRGPGYRAGDPLGGEVLLRKDVDINLSSDNIGDKGELLFSGRS